jgi:phosphatidylserine/phosphatidylglycerophosphate/cardiolipin synthase-like enzyme
VSAGGAGRAGAPDDPARWFLPAGAGATGNEGAWDGGCEVVTFTSGLAAMSAMRDALEGAIAEAGEAAAAGLPPGRRGHVYLAAWRLNGMRDLSQTNAWAMEAWEGHVAADDALPDPARGPIPVHWAASDQTVLGLLLRLLQAGVRVRVLLWLPSLLARAHGLGPHIEDHLHTARVIAAESRRLGPADDGAPLGIVALDLRVARGAGVAASHHTKALVVRGHRRGVAFCGGVDLAFTRRHALPLLGDWQSGSSIPDPAAGWPRALGVDYSAIEAVRPLTARQPSDLPVRVYGDGRTGATRQLWHDQHLRVEGPAVATIERFLGERWAAAGRARDLADAPNGQWRTGQVLFSSTAAFDAATGSIHPLPEPEPVAPLPGAPTRVQVWRTLPAGPRRRPRLRGGGQDGAFTVMAGIARACAAARELVWITDQYFWSRPLARLLNRRLKEVPGLRVLLLLPPFADAQGPYQHHARALALAELVAGLPGGPDGRAGPVAVYDLWCPPEGGGRDGTGGPGANGRANPRGRGIYAHAKTQLYDGSLLVCGSANLNRRSLTCDTEMDCAVLDRAVVADHQRRLWDWIFMGVRWPGVDLDEPGSGARFLDAVRAAAAAGPSLLVPDPWARRSPALPGGVRRPDGPLFGTFGAVYEGLLDPTSLPPALERAADAGPRGHGDLTALADRLDTWAQRRG